MKFWTESSDGDRFAQDLVVVGSGGAGLLAAVLAARRGLQVAVLEKAELFGGTTAVSGGTLWIPDNPYLHERGLSDSAEAALSYLRTVTRGHTRDDVLRAVVTSGAEMIEWLRDEVGLRFASAEDYPDYRPDVKGSVPGGRSLDPALYDSTQLGPLLDALRRDQRKPFTMAEYEQWVAFTRFPWDELRERSDAGIVSRGNAIIAPLLKAAADSGVTLVSGAAAHRLITEGDEVTGVTIDSGEMFTGRAGVMLACGGFEWDLDMVKQFLAGPVLARCSPPNNTGDGIRMGQRIGAALGNMREAFWAPMSLIPGDILQGEQLGTLLRFERQGPGSIIVDKHGRRFVNESQNYNDMTRAFHAVDPVNHSFEHLPAHVVFDQEYLEQYGYLTHRAGADLPEWMTSGRTLEDLAGKIRVPEETLRATVERFNMHARLGEDPDFTRGANDYDKYWGDGERGYPNRSLAPLEKGPFYAVEVVPGVFGTNGGLVTDGNGNVVDIDGSPVPGLFAAGNTTAHPAGGGYPGAGGTLGPGMTMAYCAARHIVAQNPVQQDASTPC